MRSDIKLTPSRVRDYLSCPLKFARLYGPAEEYPAASTEPTSGSSGFTERAMPETTANANQALNSAMSLSNSLHSALEALHRPSATELLGRLSGSADQALGSGLSGPCDLSTLSDQQLNTIVSKHWQPDGYDDTQKEEAAYLQACDILRYYARSEHTPTGQVLATEAYLTALTTLRGYKVEMSCRADRVELHENGTLEVLDYKLLRNGDLPGAHILADDLSSFLYWLLVWHQYRQDRRVRNVRISQLNLMTLTKIEVEYDQHQVIRHREALTELVATVMKGSVEPRINAGCAWCPVQQSCPSWSEMDFNDITDLSNRAVIQDIDA